MLWLAALLATGAATAHGVARSALASSTPPRARVRMDSAAPMSASAPASNGARKSSPLPPPPDQWPQQWAPAAPKPAAAAAAGAPDQVSALKAKLYALGASTNRGESASAAERALALEQLSALERLNAEPRPAGEKARGTWELVYASTQPFRSSPFFMAARAVCSDGAEAARFEWFCEQHRAALAVSSVQRVRQLVADGRLTSEFEVRAGAVPFSDRVGLPYAGGLPVSISGCICSTADLSESPDGKSWSLHMDTVRVKGSNLPLARALLDGPLELRSRPLSDALAAALPAYAAPRPTFATTYLDADTRLSRDQDGHCFLYTRTSHSAEPTDYAEVPADLGAGAWLQRFASTFLPQQGSS